MKEVRHVWDDAMHVYANTSNHSSTYIESKGREGAY